MQQLSFLAELVKRLKSENPRFFKILMTIAAILGALSGMLLWVFEKNIWAPEYKPALEEICKAILSFSGGTVFASLTATTDPKLQDTKTVTKLLDEHTDYIGNK